MTEPDYPPLLREAQTIRELVELLHLRIQGGGNRLTLRDIESHLREHLSNQAVSQSTNPRVSTGRTHLGQLFAGTKPIDEQFLRLTLEAFGADTTEIGRWVRTLERLESSDDPNAMACGDLQRWRQSINSIGTRAEEQPNTGTRQSKSVATANLPARPRIVGRDAFTQQVLDKLSQTGGRLVSVGLRGAPGVGKTTIALEAAYSAVDREIVDRALYVNLKDYSDTPLSPSEALGILIRALQPAINSVPIEASERHVVYQQLCSEHERIVVLIDNVAKTADIALLIPPAPHCAIFTTRESIPLNYSYQILVGPLDMDDGIDLISSILRNVDETDQRIQEDPQASARVVELCGSLPLALSIVGHLLAHTSELTIRELEKSLRNPEERLNELEFDRNLAVRRAFSASYSRLTDTGATAFRNFSLHPGSNFSVSPTSMLIGESIAETKRTVDYLSRTHLVESLGGFPRLFRYHDLIHLYSREVLLASTTEEERKALIEDLARGYLAEAKKARRTIDPSVVQPIRDSSSLTDGESGKSWAKREQRALSNLAQQMAEAGNYLTSACLISTLFNFINYEVTNPDLWLHACQAGLTSSRKLDNPIRDAELLRCLGATQSAGGDLLAAIQSFNDAADIYCRANLELERSDSLRTSGGLLLRLGAYADGLSTLSDSLELCREFGDEPGQYRAHRLLAAGLEKTGSVNSSVRQHEEAIQIRDRIGHAHVTVYPSGRESSGVVPRSELTSMLQQTPKSYRRALDFRRPFIDSYGCASVELSIGLGLATLQEQDLAISAIREAIKALRKIDCDAEIEFAGHLLEEVESGRVGADPAAWNIY